MAILIVLLLTPLVYILLTYIIPHFSKKTTTQLDDLIIGIIRWPVTFLVLTVGLTYAVGSEDTIDSNFLPFELFWLILIQRDQILMALEIASTMTLAFLIYQLAKNIADHFDKDLSGSSRSSFKDVAVPLVRKALPAVLVVIFFLIITYVVEGINGLNLLLSILGGLSFLLVFLFQEPLSNLFGGVSLLTDSPFKYGDLIIPENGKTYRVEEVGSRVTKLYDIKEHTTAYVPNLKLAEQQLINITKPNLEIRVSTIIGIAYGEEDYSDKIDLACQILKEIVTEHPNILGEHKPKIDAMKAKIESLHVNDIERKILKCESVRFTKEQEMREYCELFSRKLYVLYLFSKSLQHGGLTEAQRKSLSSILQEITDCLDEHLSQHVSTWLHACSEVDKLRMSTRCTKKTSQDLVLQCTVIDENTLVGKDYDDVYFDKYVRSSGVNALNRYIEKVEDGVANESKTITLTIEDLKEFSEDWRKEQDSISEFTKWRAEFTEWDNRIKHIKDFLEKAESKATKKGYDDFLVSHELLNLWEWFNRNFKMILQYQQYPIIEIVELGDYSIQLQLRYFVDNLAGENFERLERVKSWVFQETLKRFAENNIGMPYPTSEVILKKADY